MLYRVLKTFPVAVAGSHYGKIVYAGDLAEIPADLVLGLTAEGYVESLASGGLILETAAPLPLVGEVPGEQTIAQSAIVETAKLPENWRDLHHLQIIKLAKDLGGDVKMKAEAIAFLEAEEAKTAA